MRLLSTFVALCCFLPLQIRADSASIQAVAEANGNFSRDFLKAVGKGGENLVTSPLSAQIALAMVHQGARGDTARELKTSLYLPEDQATANGGFQELTAALKSRELGVVLELANRMFVQKTFSLKNSFLTAVNSTFQCSPQNVDFIDTEATRQVINSWVEQNTRLKIKELVGPGSLSASTRMVLVNAVYFNGRWSTSFEPSDLPDLRFHSGHNSTFPAAFMKQEKYLKYAKLEHLNATLIEVPYQGGKVSMVILLPASPSGLPDLESHLQNEDLDNLVTSSRFSNIRLYLPKFKIESTLELNQPLIKMGIKKMFTTGADLSEITSDGALYVSKVVQKAFIHVSENGTEAAAATRVNLRFRSGRVEASVVKVDRPFLFFLLHRSSENRRVVLFSGRVVEPKEE